MKTPEEIAVEFSERFQKNYPKEPLWEMTINLAEEINKLISSQLEPLVMQKIAGIYNEINNELIEARRKTKGTDDEYYHKGKQLVLLNFYQRVTDCF